MSRALGGAAGACAVAAVVAWATGVEAGAVVLLVLAVLGAGVSWMTGFRPRTPLRVGPAALPRAPVGASARSRVTEAVVRLGVHVARADGSIDRSEINAIATCFAASDDSDRWQDFLRDVVASEARQPNPRAAILAARLLVPSADERWLVVLALANVAAADGTVTPPEIERILEISAGLGLDEAAVVPFVFASIGVDLATGGAPVARERMTLEQARRTLDVPPGAARECVTAACGRLSAWFDPEHLAELGPEYTRCASERRGRLEHARSLLGA